MLTESKFEFFCRAVSDFGVQHVILRQHGEEIFRKDWIPEERQMQYSISKSITGTAVGLALEEGLFRLEDPVYSFFPEESPAVLTDNQKALTIRHLLTMQMGFPVSYLMGDQRRTMKETDWVSFILSRPMPDRPGLYFKYSNAGPYLAGVLIERLTGEKLPAWLMPRLFEPLGITPEPAWDRDPLGNTFGAGGLYLTTTEISRFGQLILQNGLWEGERILSKSWMKMLNDTHISTDEGKQDYSLLFWRGRNDSLSAVGRFGQYCTVVPEKDLVIAINSYDTSEENLLEYVWTYLYPSL